MNSSKITNFDNKSIKLSNGIEGEIHFVESKTPEHWAEIIEGPKGNSISIPIQIFFPSKDKKFPFVIFAVGSSGVNVSHIQYANILTSLGIGVCLTDSFGPRNIAVTYHDQRQLTYSATTYDLLMVTKKLMTLNGVDSDRIGAIGPSRGGTAVLQASMRQLADPILGKGRGLKAVLSMYPSGMFQFLDPKIDGTNIRISMGDSDKWTPFSAAQAYANSIRKNGGNISLKIYEGGEHSFDRSDIPVMFVEDGFEYSRAPLCYISDNGNFCDINGDENINLTERELREELHLKFGNRGCSLGSKPGQPERFIEELKSFFSENLLR